MTITRRRQPMFVVPFAAVAVTLILAPAAWGIYVVTPTCTTNGQVVQCDGWHQSPVQISWTWSPGTDGTAAPGTCVTQSFGSDTAVEVSCDVSGLHGSGAAGQYIDVETSDPAATAVAARPPDSNGWYNHPVTVAFGGSSFSGIASCTPAATYGGPNAMSATASGSCTDNAGKTVDASLGLDYDATPPTMTGALASRRPDFNGWYNHPVSFTFTGTDSVSGIASCSTVTYSGPASGGGSVLGSCIDRAGNVASLAVPLRYSATPPPLNVRITTGDQLVTMRWQTPSGLSSFSILRSPGLDGRRTSVVDRGGRGVFSDARVRNGVRYRYTIKARDQAGNMAVRTVDATPGIRLLSPPSGSQVTSPPLLRWTAVLRATYYNVQLFRNGRKVLSSWPARASLRLSRSWSFKDSRFRLRPGHYRWYVWPGVGPRSAALYGAMVGTATFTVTGRR